MGRLNETLEDFAERLDALEAACELAGIIPQKPDPVPNQSAAPAPADEPNSQDDETERETADDQSAVSRETRGE